MLRLCVKNYWFTGAATVAAIATAAYLAAFIDTPHQPKGRKAKSVKTRNKLSGLVNDGNTCFINTTLQALAACPLFVWWMKRVTHTELADPYQDRAAAQSLLTTIEVVNNQHPTIEANPYNTRQLVKSLQRHGWNLKSEEQDAHEFFNILFDTIDEELNPKNKSDNGICVVGSCGTEFSRSNSFNHPSDRLSPFRGYLASQLCCLTCGQKAPVRYDVFECLSIPLPKLDIKQAFNVMSVESLLKSFLAAETIGEVQCERCSMNSGRKNVFLKQLSLGKLPQCLCLHIQRSDWSTGQLTKRQDLLKFREELDVSPFVYTHRLAGIRKPVVYQLRAVVEHLGVADSGHFVTFRRNVCDGRVKWFYSSDSYVRASNIEEVLKSSPYMLYYERCT